MMIDKNAPVALDRCTGYDVDALARILRAQLERLGAADMFNGKRVAVKVNLVMKKGPEAAATTHPAVLEAMLRILSERAAEVVIAESPGGPYTAQSLQAHYRVCGIAEAAARGGAKLNLSTDFREVHAPEAAASKFFNVISPILDADVIVNLAKLKSHSLTGYSGAVKNFFGVIPGVQKFEMHARFPDYGDFGAMLCDLCQCVAEMKPTFHVLDGILAMEGNGPTGGEPRRLDCILSGVNPYNVDIAGTSLIDVSGVIMLEEAKRRGLCVSDAAALTVNGTETLADFAVTDFKKPETARRGLHGSSMFKILPKLFGGRLNAWLQPKPAIGKNCVGCGECVRSCPRHTISLADKNGRKYAVIDRSACIRCWCCQELCPAKAVKIRKNPIIRLIGG